MKQRDVLGLEIYNEVNQPYILEMGKHWSGLLTLPSPRVYKQERLLESQPQTGQAGKEDSHASLVTWKKKRLEELPRTSKISQNTQRRLRSTTLVSRCLSGKYILQTVVLCVGCAVLWVISHTSMVFGDGVVLESFLLFLKSLIHISVTNQIKFIDSPSWTLIVSMLWLLASSLSGVSMLNLKERYVTKHTDNFISI